MDLQKQIADSMNELVESGFIRETIEKHIKACVNDAIKSSIGEYSSLNRELERHIQDQIKVNLEELNLVEHNKFIISLIEDAASEYLQQQGRERFVALVQKIFDAPPPTLTYDDLVEKFRLADDHTSHPGDEFALEIEPYGQDDGRYYQLNIYKEAHDHHADFSLCIKREAGSNEFEIWNIKERGDSLVSNKRVATATYGFEREIYKMYCNATKLIIDDFEHYLDKHSFNYGEDW